MQIDCDGKRTIDQNGDKLWLSPDAYYDIPSLLSMRSNVQKYGVDAFALDTSVPSSGLVLFANYMSQITIENNARFKQWIKVDH